MAAASVTGELWAAAIAGIGAGDGAAQLGGARPADGEEAGEAGTVTMAGAGAVERWPLER